MEATKRLIVEMPKHNLQITAAGGGSRKLAEGIAPFLSTFLFVNLSVN